MSDGEPQNTSAGSPFSSSLKRDLQQSRNLSLHMLQHRAWKSLLVSLLCLISHCLFLYGQLSDVWSVDVKVDLTDVSFLGSLVGHPKIPEVNFTLPNCHYMGTIESFTYIESVQRLWNFATEYDFAWYQFSQVAWTSQLAAVLLALFSGMWPHVKLISLHLMWYMPLATKPRSRALYWLGFFGKYAMLDVFIVCYLVLLLQLRVSLSTKDLTHNIVSGLPMFLDSLNSTTLVHGFCQGLTQAHYIHHIHECLKIGQFLIEDRVVRDDVLRDFDHNVNETGYVFVQLAAQSQYGIYFYSSGVWLSLLLSLLVDIFDEQARTVEEKAYTANNSNNSTQPTTPLRIRLQPPSNEDNKMGQPLLDPVSSDNNNNNNNSDNNNNERARLIGARTISVGMVLPEQPAIISHRTISAGMVLAASSALSSSSSSSSIGGGEEDDSVLIIPELKARRTISSSRNIAYDFNKDFLDHEEEDEPFVSEISLTPVTLLEKRDDPFEMLLAHSGFSSVLVFIVLIGAIFVTVYGIVLNTQHVEIPGEVGMLLSLVHGNSNSTIFMAHDFSFEYVLKQIIGKSSAANQFLAKDFLIFGFLGPIGVLILGFFLCILPLRQKHQWVMLQLLKLSAGFAAWDVLVITHFLLWLELPSLTTGIMTVGSNNMGVYFCDLMYNSFQPNVYPCFEETFTLLIPSWILLPIAAVLVAGVSWLLHSISEKRLAASVFARDLVPDSSSSMPPLVSISRRW